MNVEEMKVEIAERLFQVLLTLLDVFSSKTLWVILAGAVSTYELTGDPMVFLYAAAGFVVKQTAADFGKEREKIKGVNNILEQND